MGITECQKSHRYKKTMILMQTAVQIVVSLINGRPGSKNFTYSPVLQQFTKATNIRLRFLRTSTLLGHLISKAQRDPSVTRRVRHKCYHLTRWCHAGTCRSPIWPSRTHCVGLPAPVADTVTLPCSHIHLSANFMPDQSVQLSCGFPWFGEVRQAA